MAYSDNESTGRLLYTIEQLRQETERVDRLVAPVIDALVDKGSHPEFHDALCAAHTEEWPVLWTALTRLRDQYRTDHP